MNASHFDECSINHSSSAIVFFFSPQITVGVFRQEERVLTRPTTPVEITEIIYEMCQPHDIREAVIQQEMVIALAKLIPVKPQLFAGMLKIRVG